ncbi:MULTISPECIES: hypothetical protein [unclassified Methanosarcina]|uniref:hypothetical protein n=1 Tax=unclassified Methanosarcina TaxID=2644672 RepID=UPI000615FC23|nr:MULTISPECIES: hypothetical protein [unclassified Methanosarcina]AKB18412.1 hypothetical protein MSWHS_1549 [Methanosarcina sp. WWM596]
MSEKKHFKVLNTRFGIPGGMIRTLIAGKIRVGLILDEISLAANFGIVRPKISSNCWRRSRKKPQLS